MATKLDIMNNINPPEPGKDCEWQIIDGKPTKIEKKETVEEPKEEKIKVVGPVVEKTIEVVKEKLIPKKPKSLKKKKGRTPQGW